MAQDTATPVPDSDCEVMASIDDDADGERLIIAELCREDAWLSMSTDATVSVDDLRYTRRSDECNGLWTVFLS